MLIACANLSSLWLARTATRQEEMPFVARREPDAAV
jgi:hypothetical protein